jgi:hypothetical protein
MRRSVFSLAVLATLLPITGGAQLVSIVDSSRFNRLESKFDMQVGGAGASLDADIKVVGEDGKTQFAPRITSNFAVLPRLDVRTVLESRNLNAQTANNSVDTRISMRPSLQFVDRIETSLLRSTNRTRESLKISFSRFDTNLNLFGGNALNFRADMQHERLGSRSVTTSNVKSSFGLGDVLSVQSALRVDDRAGAGAHRSALETRLVYAMPFSFFKSLEGEIKRGRDGEQQSLILKLSEISGESRRGSSFRLSGKAQVREVLARDGAASRRLELETKLSGGFASPFGGENSLSVKIERGLGHEDLRNATLSYNHEWAPTDEAWIELKLKTRRRGDRVEPSMDLTWSARF